MALRCVAQTSTASNLYEDIEPDQMKTIVTSAYRIGVTVISKRD